MQWHIERHQETPSTIDLARAAAERGAGEGTVIIAGRQTAGRGRLGRTWASPPGGLWVSAVLRPRLDPGDLGKLAIGAAVAAAEAVEEQAGLSVGLKWPNDLLVGDRKLGGLLLDSHLRAGKTSYVILSLGLNLNVEAEAFPPELRGRATSVLIEAGRELASEEMLQAFLNGLEECYHLATSGPEEQLLRRWRQRDVCEGRRVTVRLGAETGPEVRGVALGVDRGGALRLRQESGEEISLTAGEITCLET